MKKMHMPLTKLQQTSVKNGKYSIIKRSTSMPFLNTDQVKCDFLQGLVLCDDFMCLNMKT
jgi:hypothetical protein